MKKSSFKLIAGMAMVSMTLALPSTLTAGSKTYTVGNDMAGASASFSASKSSTVTAGANVTLKALKQTAQASLTTTATTQNVNVTGKALGYTLFSKTYTYSANAEIGVSQTVTFLNISQVVPVYGVPIKITEKLGGGGGITGAVKVSSTGCTITDKASIWATASGTISTADTKISSLYGTISGKVIEAGVKASATFPKKGSVTAASSLFANALSGKIDVGFVLLKIKYSLTICSWSGKQISELALL